MVATTPADIRGSRLKYLLFRHASLAGSATAYLMGTATASTSPVLGFKGRVTRVQIGVAAGTTGTITANVYVLPGANTPAAGYLAMSAAVVVGTALIGSSETVGAATAGAEIAATDGIAVNIVAGALNPDPTLNIWVLVTIESDI